MRAFLVLCVVALSQARPDVGIGYKYTGLNGDPQGGTAPIFGTIDNEPIVSKHFYIHAAPEDNEGVKTKHFTLGRGQKNYRVVFIRAPASGATRLSAEYAPQEEKTVIYVLAQKENELNVNDIATPAPTQPSKPEVFFIKYKTPEEAEHAQQQIQAQYDALGGSTQVSDEGLIPITSAIGSTGIQPSGLDNRGYLPPTH